jgi:exopolyphosphatase/guanosine-5'-triphosphate,3'-diphosphate pyrophosphatase
VEKKTSKKGLFGVIDIGSNSVRRVVFDVSHVPVIELVNEKVFCALGRDLSTTGRLSPDGVGLAKKTLKAYKEKMVCEGVAACSVVGTAALRDAEDGSAFLKDIQDEIGLEIRVISGDEEARYAAKGVLSLDPHASGVVADFGGGSLEFAVIENGQVGNTLSFPFGVFRAQTLGPAARGVMHKAFVKSRQQIGSSFSLYGIGGDWRSLAKAHKQENGETDRPLQGYRIEAIPLISFCRKLQNLPATEIVRLYGMEERRASLMGVSALVLETVFMAFGPRELVVSTAGVRDGLLYEYLHSN